MKIFEDTNTIAITRGTAVALGHFDGVHKGHVKLIAQMTAYAAKHGLASCVFTFSNSPKNFMRGKTVVKSILTQTEKRELIRGLGVDYLVSVPFDETFHEMTPRAFIDDLALGAMRAKAIGCGFNFRFGKNAKGDTGTLERAATAEGFVLNVLPPVKINGVLVSSTMIRELIQAGDVGLCVNYLGRRFALSGAVIHGEANGRKLGFPTANVVPPEGMVLPADGVYATLVSIGKEQEARPAVTNIGVRPTFGGKVRLSETHVLDFDGNLYGKTIRVEFVKRLRGEVKFDSFDQLSAQIASDSRNAKRVLR
ncbi:MAG: bifunctional riboflavin kinase/FAD synthetase [Clostridiales Family XIII bacterium]|jgi:riboflavin kinase/FMN adenylyltransferase|nr:bifunctional riboflavin kinase/FAD synthetase [Clostridiales Family XIII bacterium]